MKRKNIVGLIAIVAIIAMAVLAGCVDESVTPASTDEYQIKIIYGDWYDDKEDYAFEVGFSWSGSIGDIGTTTSIEGIGSKTYTLNNPQSIVSATIQKEYGLKDEPLTVQILKNGEIVKSGTTKAKYGVVSISYTL